MMAIPNFTAENALYRSGKHYHKGIGGVALRSEIVPQQGLDPRRYGCAFACAVCFGTLVAPELLLPELACAICWTQCSGGAG
jgi:hypothetical protein